MWWRSCFFTCKQLDHVLMHNLVIASLSLILVTFQLINISMYIQFIDYVVHIIVKDFNIILFPDSNNLIVLGWESEFIIM